MMRSDAKHETEKLILNDGGSEQAVVSTGAAAFGGDICNAQYPNADWEDLKWQTEQWPDIGNDLRPVRLRTVSGTANQVCNNKGVITISKRTAVIALVCSAIGIFTVLVIVIITLKNVGKGTGNNDIYLETELPASTIESDKAESSGDPDDRAAITDDSDLPARISDADLAAKLAVLISAFEAKFDEKFANLTSEGAVFDAKFEERLANITAGVSAFETKFEERLANITSEDRLKGDKGEDGQCVGVLGGNRLYVNGRMGWRSGETVNYMRIAWTPISAKVGDILIFESNSDWSSQDVWLMPNRTAYDKCDFEAAVLVSSCIPVRPGVGGYEYPLADERLANRTLFFASRKPNHCDTHLIKVEVQINKAVIMNIGVGDVADSDTIQQMESVIAALAENSIMLQTALEQRVRSQGSSGLTRVRGYDAGLKAYHDASYSRNAIANIHNHANNINTIGMGELMAVLNGVEFQTRHNDYQLLMPHKTSTEYHATEPIPFPDVPPEVLAKHTVDEQVKEMQAWFKAWKDQDWSHRDYRKYFKPVITYLEGTWITDLNNFSEPFDSDRHKIEADSWRELHEKFRYLLNSGRKNNLENLAFLPSSIRSMGPDGRLPVLANWEYRVVCHPLRDDLPLQRLRVAQDLHVQLWQKPTTKDELHHTRRARYEVNPAVGNRGEIPYPTLDDHGQQSKISWNEGLDSWGYLDYLMEQIPGKDNYAGSLEEALTDTVTMHHERTDEVLNAAYYSRFYNVLQYDAMGLRRRRRSYSDQFMWAARTTQSKVSGLGFSDPQLVDPQCTQNCARKPFYRSTRWSYAIPLEIVWLTPLSKWNPFEIIHKVNSDDNIQVPDRVVQPKSEASVTAGNRNGFCTSSANAYNGTSSKYFFRTPASFFAEYYEKQDPADTSGSETCVLDRYGNPQRTRASGHWIAFPEIGGGVGSLRQRYPIMPIHEMGNTIWKELKALEEIIITDSYEATTGSGLFGDARDQLFGFTLTLMGGGHEHDIIVNANKARQFGTDSPSPQVILRTETRNGHEHWTRITRSREVNGTIYGEWSYKLIICRYTMPNNPNSAGMCDDGHTTIKRSRIGTS